MTIRIFDDLAQLSQAAAEIFVLTAREAIQDHGQFTVALAGGNTPKELYQLLASSTYADFVQWDRVQVFFGDERWVPADDPSSNEHTARESLLSCVPISEQNIHSMFSTTLSREDQCSHYAKLLHELAPVGLDLVLLGVGDDGHTASLFPGSPQLKETNQWVVPTESPKGVKERITLTIPALTMAKKILFLAAGEDKQQPIARAVGDDASSWPPSGLVAHGGKEVIWYIDKAAAGDLVPDDLDPVI